MFMEKFTGKFNLVFNSFDGVYSDTWDNQINEWLSNLILESESFGKLRMINNFAETLVAGIEFDVEK